MKGFLRRHYKKFLVVCVLVLIIWFSVRPSNERGWTLDQMVLPYSIREGNLVHIKNIRNFTYRTTKDYSPGYYEKTFALDKIKSVDFVIEPFSNAASAHTFLTFGFEGDHYISISVEIRKEQGETFSPWKGLLKRYELMYVIADERDVIKLRSNYRKDKVYLYPVKTTKEKMQALFLDMLDRANKLKEKPEFYNTLVNTCTTNIVGHVNQITPERVPFSYKVLLPGYSDQLAYDLGLINTDLSFEKAREKFLINDRAELYADSSDFSQKIRGN